jgi:hypothetical protein
VSEAAATDERPAPSASPFIRGAQLFGLTGLAIAQPLLDLLAGGAAFFVAHDASRAEVLLVVGVILVVPALLLWVVVEAVRLGSVTAGRWVMATFVGLLVGVTIMSAVDRGCRGGTSARSGPCDGRTRNRCGSTSPRRS